MADCPLYRHGCLVWDLDPGVTGKNGTVKCWVGESQEVERHHRTYQAYFKQKELRNIQLSVLIIYLLMLSPKPTVLYSVAEAGALPNTPPGLLCQVTSCWVLLLSVARGRLEDDLGSKGCFFLSIWSCHCCLHFGNLLLSLASFCCVRTSYFLPTQRCHW